MEKEAVTQAGAILQMLADKIGITVKQLWPYFVKQAYIVSLEVFLCVVISCALSWFFTKKFFKAVYDFNQPETGKFSRHTDSYFFTMSITYGIFLTVSGIIAIVSIMTVFTDSGMAFLNPEYWAAMKLLSAIIRK